VLGGKGEDDLEVQMGSSRQMVTEYKVWYLAIMILGLFIVHFFHLYFYHNPCKFRTKLG
jgi:hypothetical protein